jgi:CelD/BcsL family acetyltransferase involved in cellulose biosynthesis
MIYMKSERIRVDLISSDEAILAIRDEWEALSEKVSVPHFFATFSFISAAWKYYRRENDQLFVLAMRRGTTLVGIAPFRIEQIKIGNAPLIRKMQIRIIRFIAEWGCGDKPLIVTIEQPEIIWERILQYLNKEYTRWDMLSLAEQPEKSPVLNQRALGKIRYSVREFQDYTSYYVSIHGTWEEYLVSRGKETRKKWNKTRKKLYDLPEGVYFDCIEDPASLPNALERYIRLEQSGWKKDLGFTIGGNDNNKGFYEELLKNLAYKKMAEIWFLLSGTTDIAAAILYKHKSTIYGAQITFNQRYAEYSPGTITSTEILKTLFSTNCLEFDFLGYSGEDKNNLKIKWSTGSRKTVTIQIYKKSLRVALLMYGGKIKNHMGNIRKIVTGNKSMK